jgi:deoxyribodipyrimidine photo-lyase
MLDSVTRSVMWFRRDLRLTDQPALSTALAESSEVLPVFVLDPAFNSAGVARQRLLSEILVGLRDATGGALEILEGDPVQILPELVERIDAQTVYVTKDFGLYGRRRDEQVAAALHASGRRLRGVGSSYAVEPGRVAKADGEPYAVFTPFSRRWREHGWPMPVDKSVDPNWLDLKRLDLDRLDGNVIRETATRTDDVLAELDVLDRWAEFRRERLGSYGSGRDIPAIEGTSGLSPYLKFGVVHPRQLLADLDPSSRDHIAFSGELAWRDFYADVLFHQPETAWSNLDRRFDRIAIDGGPAARAKFELWCQGLTGFPIVDAGMRQLTQTGWMHNRVRMIVASFLVKDLHLSWQWGARFFLRHLLDGDLASNNHGWQWAAGSGTDAAPYFRVFNPTAQEARWDPDGEYISRWIPELGTSTYPAPMVDHAAERIEALSRYGAIRRA